MSFASCALEKASSDEPLALHAQLLASNQTHRILALALDLSKKDKAAYRALTDLRCGWLDKFMVTNG